MATKTIAGSALARVLNRSLTWKETVGMSAPESKEIDDKYAAALKAFEDIPDFPDEWAAFQDRYDKLSAAMRKIESTHIDADKGQRDAHAKLIDAAKKAADELARDVGQRHRELKQEQDAKVIKTLTATCLELRTLLERLAKGDSDIEDDLKYAKQLEPALGQFSEQARALSYVSGRFSAIQEFMDARGFVLPKTIEKHLDDAKPAIRMFDELKTAPALWAKLLSDAKKVEPPPVKRQFAGLYGKDTVLMEKARIGFDKTIDNLTGAEDRLIKLLSDAKAYVSGDEFDKLKAIIDRITKMDRRRQLQEADKRSSKPGSKAVVADEDEDDDKPPPMPTRPQDASAGRTINIINRTHAPSSVLTPAEEDKVNTFIGLHNQVIAYRVRDTMNDNFGNFEFVNHHTVRLSRRRRLEFDMNMSVGGQVQITIVNIGDPTYEH